MLRVSGQWEKTQRAFCLPRDPTLMTLCRVALGHNWVNNDRAVHQLGGASWTTGDSARPCPQGLVCPVGQSFLPCTISFIPTQETKPESPSHK